jgi:ribonuclease HI
LIHGLRIVVSLGIKRLIAYGDSKVVIDQVNKVCDIKKDSMNAYCAEVCKLKAHFEGLEFHHICRDNNVAADCDNPPRKVAYYRLRPIHFGE